VKTIGKKQGLFSMIWMSTKREMGIPQEISEIIEARWFLGKRYLLVKHEQRDCQDQWSWHSEDGTALGSPYYSHESASINFGEFLAIR
jgi:hypothetical protein